MHLLNRANRWLILSTLCLFQPLNALADGGDAFEFFQEEAKVMIAAQHEQRLDEAPSIVSVINRTDIERYGDRDLADILRRIPGFEFGVDVFSEAAPAFRGIWVEEGKSLLMINGIAQNELGFGNYSFFGSIPASMIEKVEVIRGPGSAIYGGFAEVDVINVITHQPEKLNGMVASGDIGLVGHGGYSRYGNISYANKTDTLKAAAHVGYGSTLLSKRDYTDFFGNRLNLNRETAYRHWQHLITEASAKQLTVRYQRASFTFAGQDTFAVIQPAINGIYVERTNNYNDSLHLDYQAKLSDRLTVQPLFQYTRNGTWNFPFPSSVDGLYEGSGSTLWRYRGEITSIYEAPWQANLRIGGGVIRDEVESVASDGSPGLQLSEDPTDLGTRVHTSSTFGLCQYEQKMNQFTLTFGGRYEDSSFGHAFAPRAGLTYVYNAFNAKLLYGRAFRIPLPWQAHSRALNFSGKLKPEIAYTTEMELGYKFTAHLSGKINLFFIDINEPLVYQGASNTYANLGEIQSEGVEAEIQINYERFGGFVNIAYSEPGPDTSPAFTTVSKKQFIGTPPLKLNVGAYRRIGIVEIAPSLTYLSSRAGQSSDSANDLAGTLGTTDYHPLLLMNMNVMARNIVKDFDIHLSIHNIFDTRYALIQPYYGGHAPLPAQDRQITLGITWHL